MATIMSGRWQQAAAKSSIWTEKNPVLYDGEIGIESDTRKFKFGDGITPWNDLDYAGTNVDEIVSMISGYEDNCYVIDAISEDGSKLTDEQVIANYGTTNSITYQKGDMVIIRRIITGDKMSYTSYVSDGSYWRAMDGNYSAKNVYFDSDFVFTAPTGTITQDMIDEGNGSVKVTAAGLNTYDFFASIFSETIDPEVDYPSASIAVSGGSKEVGDTYTLPTATLTIDDVGSYTYGPETGITFAAGNVTLSEGADNSKSNEAAMSAGSTLKLQATDTDNTYIDGSKSYEFTATATHTAGATPKNNIGGDAASKKIESGSIDIEKKTATFTGYRKMFIGTLADTTTELNSENIRKLSLKSVQVTKSAQTFTVPVGAKRIVLAFPASYTSNTPKFEYYTMSWEEIAPFTKLSSTVPVKGLNGYVTDAEPDGMPYTVYVFTHAGASGFEAATQYRITLK